jgi:hypothetical protein
MSIISNGGGGQPRCGNGLRRVLIQVEQPQVAFARHDQLATNG